MTHPLTAIPKSFHDGRPTGITSVCTAHPEVIAATLSFGKAGTAPVLIEATCNQVNQDGGYTGMTPADFRDYVFGIADKVGFPRERLVLGGDHLGPNPWRKLDAETAMEKAVTLVDAYARAGFSKIHLDASMACKGEGPALAPDLIADRATRLAAVAEKAVAEAGQAKPVYVVGTEVPVPGGALEKIEGLEPTDPAEAAETLELHRVKFEKAGLADAYSRVIGLVVQPGVEFGNENVVPFDPPRSTPLTQWLRTQNQIVFEAHSTDYQTEAALSALVAGGFGILKVGPGLTFALREAYYGLDAIAAELFEDYAAGTLPGAMEEIMLANPGDWAPYYAGEGRALKLMRHFSYSDRIRYYWAQPAAQKAVAALMERLGETEIPETLISQYLPLQYRAVSDGVTRAIAPVLLQQSVAAVLAVYQTAVDQTGA